MIKLVGLLCCFITLHSFAQKPPERIISLAPHITELLFAAGGGDRLVGVINYSDFPEAAQRIPIIGDSHALDIERIIMLKPDLIVVSKGSTSAKQIGQLQKLDILLIFSDEHHLSDIPSNIETLGKIMGTEQQANIAALELRNQLSALTKQYANLSPVRLFYQVWNPPLFTLNGQQVVSDAIRVCGGVNIFANQKVVAPNVSVEAVLQANPEAIVGTNDQRLSTSGIAMWTRYPTMKAVKRGNLLELDGNLINRAGPRMIAGVADLCKKIESVRSNRHE